MRKIPFRVINFLLIALVLTGCTQLGIKRSKTTPPKPPMQSPVPTEERRKIQLLLAHEEYTEALDTMKKKIASGTSEQNFNALYVSAVNGVISQGEVMLENKQLAEAGMAFRRALDDYPADERMQSKVKRTASEIKEDIDRLSTSLMDTALMKYREGAIEEAIAIWDKLLAFDPQNVEAKKARDTAATQLENLKKVK